MTWSQLLERLEQPFYGNTLREWAIAIAGALALFLLLKLMQTILVSRFRAWNERLKTDAGSLFVEALASIRLWLLFIISLFAGSLLLLLPSKTTAILNSIATLALLLQAAITGNALLTLMIARYTERNLAKDAASVTTVTSLGFLGRIALWTVITLLVLQNLGINVSALVTGLGIGGIAVALAAQNILGDLLASLSIVLDKPFVLGDHIVVGDQSGTVEKIGIRTTHLRTPGGDQLIMPNNDLVKSRVRNTKRMQERRVQFNLGVTYETPREQLAALPGILRAAVEAEQPIRFDRAHFKSFGPSSLDFEVAYFVLTADFLTHMDIQQRINLTLLDRFAAAGIQVAYPTQTIHLVQAAGEETRSPLAPRKDAS